jgi:hypothetical protein
LGLLLRFSFINLTCLSHCYNCYTCREGHPLRMRGFLWLQEIFQHLVQRKKTLEKTRSPKVYFYCLAL